MNKSDLGDIASDDDMKVFEKGVSLMFLELSKDINRDIDKEIVETLANRILEDMGVIEKKKPEVRRIIQGEFTVKLEKKITRCIDCPYHDIDGGPSPVMYCSHPAIEKISFGGYIISHPECDTGFPEKCPLIEENK